MVTLTPVTSTPESVVAVEKKLVLTVCLTWIIFPAFGLVVVKTVPFAESGTVNTLVFPLEAGAFISKVPPPESAVNLI